MADGDQSYEVGRLALTHFLSPPLSTTLRPGEREREKETDGVNIEAEK